MILCLRRKWLWIVLLHIPVFSFLFILLTGCGTEEHSVIPMTGQEKAWIKSLDRPIRLGITAGWPPVSFINSEGKYDGISAEYIHIIEQKLGVEFELVMRDTWPECLSAAMNYEVDITANISMTKDRLSKLRFTDIIIDDSIVFLGLEDQFAKDQLSVEDMAKLRVGVLRNSVFYQYSHEIHPEWNYVPFDNLHDGLIKLSLNHVDVVSALETYADYQMQLGFYPLKVVHKIPVNLDTRFGIRKDWTIFYGMVDRALASITDDERQAIFDRWTGKKSVQLSQQYLLRALLVGYAVSLFIICVCALGWRRNYTRYQAVAKTVLNQVKRTRADTSQNYMEQPIESHVTPKVSCIGYAVADLSKKIIMVNNELCSILKYSRNELLDMHWDQLGRAEDLFDVIHGYENMMNGEADFYQHNRPHITGDGTLIECITTVWPLLDQDGQICGAAALILDVSQIQKYERKYEFLMRELDHRVKNNLAEILALIERSNDQVDIDTFKRTLIERVYSIARTHEALAKKHWDSLNLISLVGQVMKPYVQIESGRIHLVGEDMQVPARTCSPLSLALHELAANAYKYGALSNRTGEITIHWRLLDTDHLELIWQESGGPVVSEPSYSGFGTKLVKGLIEFELQGDVDTRYLSEGIEIHLTIELVSDKAIYEYSHT